MSDALVCSSFIRSLHSDTVLSVVTHLPQVKMVGLAVILLGLALFVSLQTLALLPSGEAQSQSAPVTALSSITPRDGHDRNEQSLADYKAAWALPYPKGVQGWIHFEKNRRIKESTSRLTSAALNSLMRSQGIHPWNDPETFAHWGSYLLLRFGTLHPKESLEWAEKHFAHYPGGCLTLLHGVARTHPNKAMDLYLQRRMERAKLFLNAEGGEDYGPAYQDLFSCLCKNHPQRAWEIMQDPSLQNLRGYAEEAYADKLPAKTDWEQQSKDLENLHGDRGVWRRHLQMRWAMFDPESAVASLNQQAHPYRSDSETASAVSSILQRVARERPEFTRAYLETISEDWIPRERVIEYLSRDTLFNGLGFSSLSRSSETKTRIAAYWVDEIRHTPPNTIPTRVFDRIRQLGHLTPKNLATLDQIDHARTKIHP